MNNSDSQTGQDHGPVSLKVVNVNVDITAMVTRL